MKSYSFDISMRTRDIFAFLLRQSYYGFRGIVNIIIIAVVIFELIVGIGKANQTTLVLLVFVLLLMLVINPLMLLMRAKAQAKLADRFQAPTHYDVDKKGITISQSGEVLEVLWGHLSGYTIGIKRIYVYTSKITAFIFPKEMLSEEGRKFLYSQLAAHKSDFGTLALETIKHTVPEDSEEASEEENLGE